jgi:hypothetical protein
MSDGANMLVYLFIVCVVVWAVIKAFRAIDSDGAIWDAMRKAIAKRMMGWFQSSAGGPSQGPEREEKAATASHVDLRPYAKELLQPENRGTERVQKCDGSGHAL